MRSIFLLFSILALLKLYSQKNEIPFELYTHLNGLSNSHVNCITQDGNGIMWFGTDYGLNKFDGFNFASYRNHPEDSTSLAGDEVIALYTDYKGSMWAGTFNGLSKFDHLTGKFRNFFSGKDSIMQLSPIRSITGDKSGKIWFGTSGHGVFVIDANTGAMENNNVSRAIGNERVYTILLDKNENLWIGTEENGIKVYYPKTQLVKHFTTNNSMLKTNSILALFEDKDGNIWIGTRGGGLSIYNTEKEKFVSNLGNSGIENEIYSFTYGNDSSIWIGTNKGGLIVYNPKTKTFGRHLSYLDEKRFKSKRIRTLFTDKDGNVWLGVHQLGVSLMKKNRYIFNNLDIQLPQYPNFLNQSILGILLDSDNNLWLGSDGMGLIKYNISTKNYEHYLSNSLKLGSIPKNDIRTIFEDSKKNVWLGFYKGGFSKYNKQSNSFTNFLINKPGMAALNYNDVVDIEEDKDGNLWLATNGDGLISFDPQTNKIKSYFETDFVTRDGLVNMWCTCLFYDSKENLWIGTYWGLSKFNLQKGTFTNYYNESGNPSSVSSNIIFSVNEDGMGNIWIGTKYGLNLYNEKDDTFQRFGTNEGLSNDAINSILIDNKNILWLASNNGISSFNYQTGDIKNYYYQDGLVSNEFIHNSAFKAKDGRLFFGSVFGFNSFYPDSLFLNDLFPQVLVTDFKIFNESVPIGKMDDGRTILTKSITETDKIKLDYYDNSFSFDFVAIDYAMPERITYACKMEGFEDKWNYTDYKRRFITYTNLDPGSYTLLVKASNRKDEWGEKVTKIHIEIRPPIWQTGWAYTIYIVLFLGIFLLLWKITNERLTEKKQIEAERIKKAQDDKINQAKLEFFTNISHEFRTPLTLIIGPIENLLEKEKFNNNVKKALNLMSRNAHRLLRLVNQLLDLRKIEKEKLKLQASKTNILVFVEEIFESFQELAKRKEIHYEFEKVGEIEDVYFDHDKLDKILFNLLSNAFKFTPQKGLIKIIITENSDHIDLFPEGYIKIDIEDNGIGMSSEEVNRIFDRFYQSQDSIQSVQSGTGIGLSLSKSLVEIHHGKLRVESTKGEGSIFSVLLPKGKSHLKDEEIVETKDIPVDKDQQPVVLKEFEEDAFGIENDKVANDSSPLILLVEDNLDVRSYIKNGLKGQYRISEAENGKEGLKLAHDLMPDLIISDVMMPEMDGIALCKKLKTELVTCHIPVILLTAKSSIEHRIEGLETGADSYIPKPFNPKHLLVRINKLIELRQKLKNKFQSDGNFEPIEMAVTSTDEKFLNKTIEIIKKKIADPELGVETLGEEVGMSRGHLHRKLKGLVGQAPSEFIRTIRLKQAAYLLENEKIPVSEIGYMVGFSSPSYFAKCFNKQYNLTPTQYKEKTQG